MGLRVESEAQRLKSAVSAKPSCGDVGRGSIYRRRLLRSIRKGIKSIDPIGRRETRGGGEYTAGGGNV